MTTIINSPKSGEEGSGSGGIAVLIGVLVAVIVIGLFVAYVLPDLREGMGGEQKIEVDVKLPEVTPVTPPSAE